jgi:hypothetical protein
MMRVNEFFQGRAGKATVIVFALIALVALIASLKRNFGMSEIAAETRYRTYICSETKKTFEFDVTKGTAAPVPSPYSGKNTGYPAERCFWTRDGKIKKEPTYVLLNQYANIKGPTFCPDCGRLVKPMNPPPILGDKPPPTQAEYKPGDERRND